MMHYFFVTGEQTDKLILGVDYIITFDHIFPQVLSILSVVRGHISIETSAWNQTAFILNGLLLHTILILRSTVIFLDTEKSIKRLSSDTLENFL